MEIDKQLNLGHLLFTDRKCRSCGLNKNLVGEFYRTRKDRGPVASSYSYECKECTVKRVINNKRLPHLNVNWQYPDW
jgi:hypothetical protein